MNKSKVRIVLQARMSSTRLPGKVLLPIASVPLVILCAKRLSRDGLDLVVATSSDESDDPLVAALDAAGISYVRGSLNNVLSRFILATHDMDDGQIVVRATADNPVPDADFIRDLVDFMENQHADYVTTDSPADGLPYGLSAEVMTVGVLREAAANAAHPFDFEHVTPWIRRHCQIATIDHNWLQCTDGSFLRCTIDTFDDYLRVNRAFTHLGSDSILATWLSVVDALGNLPETPSFRIPYRLVNGDLESCMSLGTVQLGLPYGINNQSGQPPESVAIAIVRRAIEHGVSCLDTAQAYGDAESKLALALKGSWRNRVKVITKLAPLIDLPPDRSQQLIEQWVDSRLFTSLFNLQTTELDVLMLHRWSDYSAQDGAVWQRLIHYKNTGKVRALGASVYNPDQAIEALAEPAITHIQVPFNLLDRRWVTGDFISKYYERSDVRIHVRSVFLQGLLLSRGTLWPACDPGGPVRLKIIDELVTELNRESRADLCIAYVRGHPWVTSVVLGLETLEQLDINLQLVKDGSPLTPEEIDLVHFRLAAGPECVVDPSQWIK